MPRRGGPDAAATPDFDVVLAGGGIKPGQIYGQSNPVASEPEQDELGPADLATTVYHLLGIVADKEVLPWNAKISIDANYRANTTTLTNPAEGTGILDIL